MRDIVDGLESCSIVDEVKTSDVENELSGLLKNFEELLDNIIAVCKERQVLKIDRCEVVGGNSNWQLFKNKLLEFFRKHENMISLHISISVVVVVVIVVVVYSFILPEAHQ